MTLTRTAKDSKTNTNSLAISSNSFTPSNSSLLIVAANFQPPGGATLLTSDMFISDTQTLTWTKRFFLKNSGAGNNYTPVGAVWTAPVVTGTSMTVTCSITNITGNDGSCISVVEYTGHNIASPIGATAFADIGNDGAQSVTLSGTPASTSEIYAGRHIADGGDTVGTATPGAAFTEIHDLQSIHGLQCLQIQARPAGSTSTTVDWIDVYDNVTDAGYEGVGFALEIKDGGGGEIAYPGVTFRRVFQKTKTTL